MSEALDRVRGVRELPVFPLNVVLFPGTPLPLHIFEPRYRRMLADVQVTNNLFGVSYFDPKDTGREAPEPGHVGCVTEVTQAQSLPDGRSNILTIGLIRYRLERYLDSGEPYLVGAVSYFEDDAEDDDLLMQRAGEATELFMRIARAVRTINDERASLPELPETDPEHLSFLIAATMDLDPEIKQGMLELKSTAERLTQLRDLLARAVSNYEERARVHSLAKGNGHAGKKVEL